MRSLKVAGRAALFALGAAVSTVSAGETAPTSPAAIQQELRSFATLGSVLYVAAHPDDENTQLITYLARGRGYRTAYLSLTRGDGGQNEIGPEFDEKLGVARTQELLAARRLDGGQQFFTRAIDFGFSKTPEETLRFWNRDQVLGDVVRVIRKFRPDVVITRFPIPPGSGGHGHHTASAILAVEAFKLAGDAHAYPEQLKEGLMPWQPKRIFWNGAGGRGGPAPTGPTVKIDIGGTDVVSGESFASIAARSRGMHITQGFGNIGGRGAPAGPREEIFTLLGGEPAEKDLMDGIDLTWARVANGAQIGHLADEAVTQFNPSDPAASAPALLAIRGQLRLLGAHPREAYPQFVAGQLPSPADPLSLAPVLNEKIEQLDRILCACLGLHVRSVAQTAEIVPGEKLPFRVELRVQSGVVPVTLDEIITEEPTRFKQPQPLEPGKLWTKDAAIVAPARLTQPYWLQADPVAGMARVLDPELVGRAENPPALPIGYRLTVGNESLELIDQPVCLSKTANAERMRPVDIIAPVSLRFVSEVFLFAPGEIRPVTVEISAARAQEGGTVQLETPADWKVSPAQQPFRLGAVGEKARFTFSVTAPAQPAAARVGASATIQGKRYSNQRVVIDYAHLPFLLLQPAARARLLAANVHEKGKNVGYLPGAGDSVAETLQQMGYTVTPLAGSDLTPEKLHGLDAVVIGVRAFNERKDLAPNLPALFAYVEAGGTVVAQYNRPANNLPPLAPYSLSIAGPAPQLRVTDETAPVTFLAPDHPALNVPNKITPADFEGWVQERGAYFPSSWDESHFTPLLAMNDPGEAPLKSSVLVAKYGQGYFVYTGLAFFRQLPAGVPGAYRLFANLVSLGKE